MPEIDYTLLVPAEFKKIVLHYHPLFFLLLPACVPLVFVCVCVCVQNPGFQHRLSFLADSAPVINTGAAVPFAEVGIPIPPNARPSEDTATTRTTTGASTFSQDGRYLVVTQG